MSVRPGLLSCCSTGSVLLKRCYVVLSCLASRCVAAYLCAGLCFSPHDEFRILLVNRLQKVSRWGSCGCYAAGCCRTCGSLWVVPSCWSLRCAVFRVKSYRHTINTRTTRTPNTHTHGAHSYTHSCSRTACAHTDTHPAHPWVSRRRLTLRRARFRLMTHPVSLSFDRALCQDLQSANILEICAALHATCKLLTADMIPAVFPVVQELLKHEQYVHVAFFRLQWCPAAVHGVMTSPERRENGIVRCALLAELHVEAHLKELSNSLEI